MSVVIVGGIILAGILSGLVQYLIIKFWFFIGLYAGVFWTEIIFLLSLAEIIAILIFKIKNNWTEIKRIYLPLNPWKRIAETEFLLIDIYAREYLIDAGHLDDIKKYCDDCNEPIYYSILIKTIFNPGKAIGVHLNLKCKNKHEFTINRSLKMVEKPAGRKKSTTEDIIAQLGGKNPQS